MLTDENALYISNSNGCKLMGFTTGNLKCHVTRVKILNLPTLFSPSVNNIRTNDADLNCPPIAFFSSRGL